MYVLKQRVHATWFLTIGCVGLLIGIALARYTGQTSILFVVAGGLAALLAFVRRHAWMLGFVLVGAAMVGLWRGGLEMQAAGAYRQVIGKTVTITGKVSADPQAANGDKQAIVLANVSVNGAGLHGTIYATVGDSPKLRRGDKVTIIGNTLAGYGNYDASMYDATIQNVQRAKDIFLDVRDALGVAIRTAVAEPMASLGIGFLVGQKSELPTDFSEALKIAGLTHIVVASGYNLTILVRMARRLFEKVSKYQAALWSVLMIVGFMAITGWSASMTRAGLVAGLSLWAWYYGRQFHPVTLLAIAASVTAVIYPPYVWGDIGWSLSFTAFAGVIILGPLLQAYFYGEQKVGFVARTLLETVSAQLLTLPIMLGVFGQFSVIALLSNIMILPLVPLAMLLTFVAGLSQLLLPALAQILSWPAETLLGYMVWAVNWTASFPWAQVKWQLPALGVALSYAVIIGMCVYLRYRTGYQLRQVNIVE